MSISHFQSVLTLLEEEKAVTAVEYGLLAGAIALAIVIAVGDVGMGVNNAFSALAGYLSSI